jgi:hypothetical protein
MAAAVAVDAVAGPQRGRHPSSAQGAQVKLRLSYTSVTATLALFIAIGGTGAAGAQALLSGRDVKDDSLTGVDIQNDSLTGADIRPGSLGSNVFSTIARGNLRGATGPAGPRGEKGDTGAQGPAGAGVTATVVSGNSVTNYVDGDQLATGQLSAVGDYVVFAHLTATNTGGTDENLDCGLFINGQQVGGGGVYVTAGSTASGMAIGAISIEVSTDVALKCQQDGTPSTFDISDVSMRIHNLG